MNKTKDHDEANVNYTLDSDDVIISINDAWDSFAETNNATQLSRSSVIGKPLFQYISGDATRMFVWSIFNNVRIRQEEYIKPYRCDSSELKRYMKMTITPLDKGRIEIANELIAVETKSFLTNIKAYKSRIRRCSMCNRLNHKDTWKEPESLIKEGALNPDQEIYVIYTVCNDCRYQPSRNAALKPSFNSKFR